MKPSTGYLKAGTPDYDAAFVIDAHGCICGCQPVPRVALALAPGRYWQPVAGGACYRVNRWQWWLLRWGRGEGERFVRVEGTR